MKEIRMDYKSCKYYSQGYCLKGEKTASGMNYTCIERNDCPEVKTTYLRLQYAKPEIFYPEPRKMAYCKK